MPPPGKAPRQHADEGRERRDLHRHRHVGRDAGRRALVDVRRPLVERHRRDLEGEADEDESETGHRERPALPGRADPLEVGVAGRAVEERHPVEEKRAREAADQEVLEGGLVAPEPPPVEARQHVDRDAHDLDPEEHHHHVDGGDEQHHAAGREQHERVVLAVLDAELGEVADREERREQGRERDHRDREVREAVEAHRRVRRVEDDRRAGEEGVPGEEERGEQEPDRHERERRAEPRARHRPVEERLAGRQEDLEHQHDERTDRHDDCRAYRAPVDLGCGNHRAASGGTGVPACGGSAAASRSAARTAISSPGFAASALRVSMTCRRSTTAGRIFTRKLSG